MRTYFLFFVAANACVSGQWLNHQTAGVPRKPDGSPNLSAPAPKTPMGKPDLSGLWRLGFGPYSFDATKDLTRSDISTWAADLQKQNMETEGKDRWSVTCLPGGPALGIDRQIAKIVQTPELIVILYEDLSYRQIFLDGRELPGDPNPDWMGYSVGRWEGDTLVVESAGFNDRTWLDYGGHPHTEALRITELFRRTDLGHIDLQIKYSDSKAYTKPWIIRTNLALAADTELIEYVCAENERDRPHMVGRASEDLKNAVIVAPELLAKYAGTYELVAPGDRVPVPMKVDLSGTQLTVDFNGNSPLTAVSDTAFTVWMVVSDRSPKMLRGIRLDFYWDGAKTPAVSAPLGDFFGIGLGETVAFQSALFSNPGGRSFNSFVPMPFRTGMRMVMTNETDTDLMALYYDVDYTVGDRLGPDVLYFHTYFRRENPTKMQHDYEPLPRVAGKGRFLGVNLGVIANKAIYGDSWWGEGEVKIYLDDDDQFPALNGTGTEDYIGSAYGMAPYAHSYQGAPFVDNQRMRFAFYRYHVEDPVYFREAIRVTIQQIGIILPRDIQALSGIEGPLYKAGPGLIQFDKSRLVPLQLFEREDDWSSCAYFYLDKPENNLPKLGDVRERIRGL